MLSKLCAQGVGARPPVVISSPGSAARAQNHMAGIGALAGSANPFLSVRSALAPPIAMRSSHGVVTCEGCGIARSFLLVFAESAVSAIPVALPLTIVVATVASHRRFREGRHCGGSDVRKARPHGTAVARRASRIDDQAVHVPANLYELLGTTAFASTGNIKQAYYDKMKLVHPDVAGEEGQDMCMLLNDAYKTLSDPESRAAYDSQVMATPAGGAASYYTPPEPADLKPTWTRPPLGRSPLWTGVPYSRSLWDRVPEGERGSHWAQQQFMFVDEWSCISCRNCCDVAPKTFCIDGDAGRARVFAQWGNNEVYLDYAVQSCPVDCIHWVGREELAILEHVTREKLAANGNNMPCPMAARRGDVSGLVNPFQLAAAWKVRKEAEAFRRAKRGAKRLVSAAWNMQERFRSAYARLSGAIRQKAWGSAVP